MKAVKKTGTVSVLILALVLLLCQPACANMAAPAQAETGSAITFEQNETISVTSETLDIEVHGAKADITAAYQMKNTANAAVSTPVMFLSPNVEKGGTAVTANGEAAAFTVEHYTLNRSTDVTRDDWRYAVLTEAAGAMDAELDSVSFALEFAPGEEYEVTVSYTCALGGYPDYDFDAKRGEIEYYLTPAALWRDFGSLTINLYLDEDMPVITSSSLDFEKVGTRHYRYVSDTLPEEDLRVTIDENWFQNIFSTLRSPYLWMFAPIWLTLAAVVVVVVAAVLVVRRIRKKKREGRTA